MNDRPLVSYEPNSLLAWVYNRFFEHIEVDDAWARAVRDADARGTVVYVLRNLSFVDFFALDYLTKRHELPQVRFANDLGLWILEPMGRGWLNALRPRNETSDAEDLRRALSVGASAALFLKRPAALLEGKTRGKIEGDAFIDTLFGPREWPGQVRAVAQFLANYRHVTLRAGEPVDVGAFLAREGGTTNGSSDDVLV